MNFLIIIFTTLIKCSKENIPMSIFSGEFKEREENLKTYLEGFRPPAKYEINLPKINNSDIKNELNNKLTAKCQEFMKKMISAYKIMEKSCMDELRIYNVKEQEFNEEGKLFNKNEEQIIIKEKMRNFYDHYGEEMKLLDVTLMRNINELKMHYKYKDSVSKYRVIH
ncbi:putative SP-containing protein [Vairimorpha necatrix]|uniref:SP-containing protein n=1 Tax=Vairimorpha necatrix TaxID=6039 RepID=A0AAX4JB52_9MICR